MKKYSYVWDVPLRLFHWGLASAVFYSWFSIEVLDDMQQHFYAGYAVLTLLLFRLIWGFIGSPYARFCSFIFSPSEVIEYAKDLFSKSNPSKNPKYLGHNPLGGLSAMLMIVALLAQASLGLLSSDDYFFGPLSGLVESTTIGLASQFHSLNSNLVFTLIGMHVLAIIFCKIVKKQALTAAMFTGKKPSVLIDVSGEDNRLFKQLLAVISLVVCSLIVYWLATAFLDRLPTPTESYY